MSSHERQQQQVSHDRENDVNERASDVRPCSESFAEEMVLAIDCHLLYNNLNDVMQFIHTHR